MLFFPGRTWENSKVSVTTGPDDPMIPVPAGRSDGHRHAACYYAFSRPAGRMSFMVFIRWLTRTG
jgi:hypothetical protein